MKHIRMIIKYNGVVVNELIFMNITSALKYVHELLLIDKSPNVLETYEIELKLIK